MNYGALKGLAAAAGLALAMAATPASAAFLVNLNSSAMDGTYRAVLNYGSITNTQVLSNGTTFNVTNIDGPEPGDTYDLFAFCIDIFHRLTLGTLNDIYVSTADEDPQPPVTDGSGVTLSLAQTNHITTLANIGLLLNRDHPGAETSLQTAAIQAAIWEIEHPGSVTLVNPNAHAAGGTTTYAQYYNSYLNLNGSGADFFTLTDSTAGGDRTINQGFVVGLPGGGGGGQAVVPEPATWALMLSGFFGAGLMIRRRAVTA
jgi:hypothetical protein